MRRSICHCEPTFAFAGQTATWKFVYTSATQLPKGTKIRFFLESKGRPFDWQIPQTNLKEKNNLIWLEMEPGKSVGGTESYAPKSHQASFDFVLPQELKAGESFTIFLGTNRAQRNIQRRRIFSIGIDPKGKADLKEQEEFHLDVKGAALKMLRIITPSLVSRNKRFDVIVRFEDEFGNLTSNAPEGTLIDLSYQHLRENLNWKLFVPETGFIALPNLYFNEPGIYRLNLRNLQNNELFFSSPIKCLAESPVSLYWGLLHGESEKVDSAENIETFLRHVRDDRALQFYATSCFDSEEETTNELWKHLNHQITEFNEDERFIAFLGFQWQGDPQIEGIRHFIYTKDGKTLLRKKDTKNNSLKKIFKTNNPKEMLAIPSFTMSKQHSYNFEDFNPEFEKVVEIYNAWGSSECSAKEGNLRPIEGPKQGTSETAEGSVQKALARGHRFGFVAGGYDDRGCYSDLYDAKQTQYSEGLTAILAKEHTKASLAEAIQTRSCYATTGKRIVIAMHIAGFGMGSELDTKNRPGLEFNRHITGYCIGTAPFQEIVIIRNGSVFRKLDVQGDQIDFTIDDTDLLGSIALQPSPDKPPFAYYYLRALQTDGHIAWSSPIWIDLAAKNGSSSFPTAKKPKKF